MLQLRDGLRLYHGSSIAVEQPDLSKCSPRKDFGRGFYLTSSVDQARAFARIVAKRKDRENEGQERQMVGFVSEYAFRSMSGLSILAYEEANADWLHCIVAHRKGDPFIQVAKDLESVDIVVGKVANDQTNATILAYLAGAYGELGSESADEICIGLLLPERLQDQVCFRTRHALECLDYLGCEEVRL